MKLLIDGMTCSACTGAVDGVLRGVDGVEAVSVALLPEGSAEAGPGHRALHTQCSPRRPHVIHHI